MTTIPAEPKKRHRLTQEDCDTARLLMARRRTLKEIAEIIGVDPSTVGKIRLADYNLEKYLEQRKAMNQKTKENKRNRFKALVEETKEEFANAAKGKTAEEIVEEAKKRPRNYQEYLLQLTSRAAAGGIAKGAEQVAGQLQMELPEAEEQKQETQPKEWQKTILSMAMEKRFQAAMMDKLLKKLDELIDVLKGGGSHE